MFIRKGKNELSFELVRDCNVLTHTVHSNGGMLRKNDRRKPGFSNAMLDNYHCWSTLKIYLFVGMSLQSRVFHLVFLH